MRFLENRTPLELGPFRVTPYLADHSAFDAYQLLVEAKGRRLFYSGDFRGHGRKARLFERLLAEPPPVDTLLLEGTRVSQNEDWGRERLSTEIEVENAACEWFAHTQGLALVSYSAQNVDRLISLYRASRRANRLFVFDLYGATIATATGRTTIPQPGWDGVRTFVPLGQRIRVKRARAFERSTVSVAVVSSPNRSRVMRVDSLSRCAAR